MRHFCDLPHHEQALLLLRTVQLIADGDTYASIEEIAAGRHTSPQLLWLKICADEGFEACEPWPGFPGLPKDFSMAGTVAPEHPLTAQLREKLTRFAG